MERFLPVLFTVVKGAVQALGIVAIIFVLCRVVPGDVVDVMNLQGGLTAKQEQALRQELGLDQPMAVQFVNWGANAIHGNFGNSLRYETPVSDMLLTALPVTLRLAGVSFVIGLALALVLSIAAISTRSIWLAFAVNGLNIWAIATPTFCVAYIAILIFSVWLHWLPVLGGFLMGTGVLTINNAGHLIKPFYEELKEAVSLPHVRTARAKGLGGTRIAVAHILPAAAPVILALSGIMLGALVSGTITMEVVFGLPGIGSLALNAILGRDYPVVMAAITVIAIALVAINTFVDIVHRAIDPRMS